MKLIPIAETHAGMILADDVSDARGTPLLGKGTILTDQHLAILKRRGIVALPINEEEESDNGGGDENEIALYTQRIRHMFFHHQNDPRMMRLQAIALRHAENGDLHG